MADMHTPNNNQANQNFARGLNSPSHSQKPGIGKSLERGAVAIPAVATNLIATTATGLANLTLPAVNKVAARASTPLPALTTAIAAVATIVTAAVMRPRAFGSVVGSLVAGSALFNALNTATNSAAPAKLPKS